MAVPQKHLEARRALSVLQMRLAAIREAHSKGGLQAEFCAAAIEVEPPTPTLPGAPGMRVAADLPPCAEGSSAGVPSSCSDHAPTSPSSSSSGSAPSPTNRRKAEKNETKKTPPSPKAASAPRLSEPALLVAARGVLNELKTMNTSQYGKYQKTKLHYKGQYGLVGRALSLGKEHYERNVKPEKVLFRQTEEEMELAKCFVERLQKEAKAQGFYVSERKASLKVIPAKASTDLNDTVKSLPARQTSQPPSHMVPIDKASSGSISSLGETDTPQTIPTTAPIPAVPPTGPTTMLSGTPPILIKGASFTGSAGDTDEAAGHSHSHSHSPASLLPYHDGPCGTLACTLSGCGGTSNNVPIPSSARQGSGSAATAAAAASQVHLLPTGVTLSETQSDTSFSDNLDSSYASITPPYPEAE